MVPLSQHPTFFLLQEVDLLPPFRAERRHRQAGRQAGTNRQAGPVRQEINIGSRLARRRRLSHAVYSATAHAFG